MKRAILCSVFAAACGGGSASFLSVKDNDPAALARARGLEKATTSGKPVNGTGTAMVFLVTGDGKLVAWDLAAKKAVWTVAAKVGSRVAVGRDRVVAREGDGLVARALTDGHVLWTRPLGKGGLVGVTVDGDRVAYVAQEGAKEFALVGLAADGHEAWRAEAPGKLGAPAARGGLVVAPFMSQWLDVFDGATGERVARLRQDDEAISWARATPDGVFYGSKGVIAFDDKSAAGRKDKQHYGKVTLPEPADYGPGGAVYSALDRNRLLWRAQVAGDTLRFVEDTAVVLRYRFFFAVETTSGQLRWAHAHPRTDVVAADDDGRAVVYVTTDGAVGALDRATGAVLGEAQVGAHLVGATFDAEGWRPEGDGAPSKVVDALTSIITDRDARFNGIKVYATKQLKSCSGKEVTSALLRVLGDNAAPADVQRAAGDVLVERKDADGLNDVIQALSVRNDYAAGTRPRGVEALARAAGAIGRPEAGPALAQRLEDPATPREVIPAVADALAEIHAREAGPALRAYLMLYRTDPDYAGEPGELEAVMGALVRLGTPAEREVVSFVAGDPRTAPAVAEAARRALGGR